VKSDLGVAQLHLGLDDVGAALLDLGLERRRIELGQDLAARTAVLKSAYSARMIPDTWLPTWTVVTADREPVAVTVIVMSPRSTGDVRYADPSTAHAA